MIDRRVRDRVLLLLAIKPPGKLVDFEHIFEKVHRDSGASREEILSELNKLVAEGLVEREGGLYRITEDGRREAWPLAFDESMNRSYRYVLIARWYYKYVENHILPFLRQRPVSVVKVFSDEEDPIGKVKPIFARYAKQKPKRYNYINSVADLWRYIDMHAIDFVPYVHSRPDAQYPDWLVIDIDAGDVIKTAGSLGFGLIKDITIETYLTLVEDFEIKACVKFSGSRGFQIWATFDTPLGDFAAYRDSIKTIQRAVEKRLSERYGELREKYGNIFDTPITTTEVAHAERRKKKILLDWSCLKPEGDVRAPWSLHWKTCLVSVPVDPKALSEFTPEDANPVKVAQNVERLSKYFDLAPSPSALLKRATRPSLELFFG